MPQSVAIVALYLTSGSVRALGETDLNPVSGLGKISQLFFAWIQPGNIVANIIAGGVAEAGAQQYVFRPPPRPLPLFVLTSKTGLCQSGRPDAGPQDRAPRPRLAARTVFRAAHRLLPLDCRNDDCVLTIHARVPDSRPLVPRADGVCVARPRAPPSYVISSLPFPSSFLVSVRPPRRARKLTFPILFCRVPAAGDGELPEKSAAFMAAFAVLFGAVAAGKAYAARSGWPYAKWIPSGVAFAIGFLNTPSFSLARLVGGVVEHVYYTRVGRENGGIKLIVIASGFVLGEGVVSIVSLVLRTFGVGVASCVGCGHGMCGGCPAA